MPLCAIFGVWWHRPKTMQKTWKKCAFSRPLGGSLVRNAQPLRKLEPRLPHGQRGLQHELHEFAGQPGEDGDGRGRHGEAAAALRLRGGQAVQTPGHERGPELGFASNDFAGTKWKNLTGAARWSNGTEMVTLDYSHLTSVLWGVCKGFQARLDEVEAWSREQVVSGCVSRPPYLAQARRVLHVLFKEACSAKKRALQRSVLCKEECSAKKCALQRSVKDSCVKRLFVCTGLVDHDQLALVRPAVLLQEDPRLPVLSALGLLRAGPAFRLSLASAAISSQSAAGMLYSSLRDCLRTFL